MLKFIGIFSLFLIPLAYSRDCAPRDFGHGGTVCVCNTTYCDDFAPLLREKINAATVVETNRKGDRFKRSFIPFTNTTNPGNATKKYTVTLNNSKRYQRILGFGGAFTDSTGYNLAAAPRELADNIIKDYFSTNGLEYSMGRVPMAGTDFSTRTYSYDDVNGDLALVHWALAKEDLEYKIPFIKLAQLLSPHNIKLFGSPWSPPAWMKTNSKFNESGRLRGELGGEYYQSWAGHFVKFLDAYKDHGIDFWGLTVENEPIEGQNPNYKFNCLYLDPEMERDFVVLNLGPTLEKAGYGPDKINLMIFDENRNPIVKWADTILGAKNASKYLTGVAYHWYSNDDKNLLNLDAVHEKYPNFFLLSSEACILKPPNIGNWDNGEKYAYNIIQDLNHWAAGWVDWNMALDTAGQPRWAKDTTFDSPLLINLTSNEYYKQPMFYALGHFSKFLPPNSVRVGLDEESHLDNLVSVAFERPDNATVVIVLNRNTVPVDLTIKGTHHGWIVKELSPQSINSFIYA